MSLNKFSYEIKAFFIRLSLEKAAQNRHLVKEKGLSFIKCQDYEAWYFDGRLHRKDGPALILFNKTKEWYIKGFRHKIDGPAFTTRDGYKAWYMKGKRHRADGPARIFPDRNGYQWWLNGQEHSLQEYLNLIPHENSKALVAEIGEYL